MVNGYSTEVTCCRAAGNKAAPSSGQAVRRPENPLHKPSQAVCLPPEIKAVHGFDLLSVGQKRGFARPTYQV